MHGDMDDDIRGRGSGDLWLFITVRDLVCLELCMAHSVKPIIHGLLRLPPCQPVC